MIHYFDCFYCFSRQRLWRWIKSRQLLLQSILKQKRKHMTYIFFPLEKTLKHVNHIWEWETGMESTILCLRLGHWKHTCLSWWYDMYLFYANDSLIIVLLSFCCEIKNGPIFSSKQFSILFLSFDQSLWFCLYAYVLVKGRLKEVWSLVKKVWQNLNTCALQWRILLKLQLRK